MKNLVISLTLILFVGGSVVAQVASEIGTPWTPFSDTPSGANSNCIPVTLENPPGKARVTNDHTGLPLFDITIPAGFGVSEFLNGFDDNPNTWHALVTDMSVSRFLDENGNPAQILFDGQLVTEIPGPPLIKTFDGRQTNTKLSYAIPDSITQFVVNGQVRTIKALGPEIFKCPEENSPPPITVFVPVGPKSFDLTVTPNPTRRTVFFEMPEGAIGQSFTVTEVATGRVIDNIALFSGQTSYDFPTKGLYMISSEGQSVKVVVTH